MENIDPLYAEALAGFEALFAQAHAAGEPDPTAMALATATPEGTPSLRMVLMKQHDARGFVFYTHKAGRKGLELQANAQAALLFFWPRVENAVQVRIEGRVEEVSAAEADAYFATRPRDSQLGAWASRQSEVLESREAFDTAFAVIQARFDGQDVPRPPGWTGYRLVPEAIELWHGAAYRLHERVQYRKVGDVWTRGLLYP